MTAKTAENQTDPIKSSSSVTPAEIAIGAVAAVAAAFACSFLGVAGTVTGAALASIVTPVSAALVRRSAERTNVSLQRTNRRLQAALARDEDEGLTGQNASADVAGKAGLGTSAGADDRSGPLWTRKRVVALGGASLVALMVALFFVTGLESAIGKPLSALLGNNNDRGTTIGRVVGSDGQGSSQRGGTTTTTAPAETTAGSPTADATESPSVSPTATVGSPSPSEPAASPTPTGQVTTTHAPAAPTASHTP
jgi:hypothetical protein